MVRGERWKVEEVGRGGRRWQVGGGRTGTGRRLT